jgi:hypothetical protein
MPNRAPPSWKGVGWKERELSSRDQLVLTLQRKYDNKHY